MQTYRNGLRRAAILRISEKTLLSFFPVFVSFGLLYEYILLAGGCPISAIKTPPIIQQKKSAYIDPLWQNIIYISDKHIQIKGGHAPCEMGL